MLVCKRYDFDVYDLYAPAEDPDFPIDEVRSALGGYAAAFCWWERFQAQGNSSSMRLAG